MPALVPPVLPTGTLSRRLQPTLTRDGLALRPWAAPDAPVLVDAYADASIQRWHVRAMAYDEAQLWISSRAARWRGEIGADWAVSRDGAVVGRVGLRTLDLAEGYGEVAYWVLPEARGAGIATAAVSALAEWALHSVGLHRLELRHSVDNEASCRVAAKASFTLEGTMRQQLMHSDGWHDMHLHARLAT